MLFRSLNLRYYINQSDKNRSDVIQKQVTQAIEEYIQWQQKRMGLDINPDMLRSKIIHAGAKRVEVNSPEFTVINAGCVASMASKEVIYGGLEDD